MQGVPTPLDKPVPYFDADVVTSRAACMHLIEQFV